MAPTHPDTLALAHYNPSSQALAHIFETYVFVYLGLSLFTIEQVGDNPNVLAETHIRP